MMWAITIALIVLALFIGGMADKLGSLVLELRRIRLAFEAQNSHYGIGTPTATEEDDDHRA